MPREMNKARLLQGLDEFPAGTQDHSIQDVRAWNVAALVFQCIALALVGAIVLFSATDPVGTASTATRKGTVLSLSVVAVVMLFLGVVSDGLVAQNVWHTIHTSDKMQEQ